MDWHWVLSLVALCSFLSYMHGRDVRIAVQQRSSRSVNQLDLTLKNQLVSGSQGNARKTGAARGLGTVDTTPRHPQTVSSVGVPAPGLYVVRDDEGPGAA